MITAHSRDLVSILRGAVGIGSLIAPITTGRMLGLGRMNEHPHAALVMRLFGARDLVLAQGARHRDPTVRKSALEFGVRVDAIDVVASSIALRRGGSRSAFVSFGGGAVLFLGLGLLSLREW